MPKPAVTPRQLVRFWTPLLATWLMMAFEGPFLAAVIARLADPKPNLAAYGVAFAFAIILEAPVIMMLSAATALVSDRDRHRALARFVLVLNALLTVAMAALVLTPAFTGLATGVIGLSPEVARLTRIALIIMLPWPAAIGFRRYDQGILIRSGRTRRVATGTVVRLVGNAGTALLLAGLTELPGAWVGAAGLAVGVVGEAVVTRWMARPAIAALPPAPPGAAPLSPREILVFYVPLALTSTIALAVHPLVTFFVGQARFALESLAVLPVLNSLVFLFRTIGLSYQEVAIAKLDEDPRNLGPVLRFAGGLTVIASGGLGLLAFTPLARLWFEGVSGLSPELAGYALLPVRLLVVIPASSVILAMQRALLVRTRDTRPITWSSVVEVAGIAGVLGATIHGAGMVGVTAAAVAAVAGRLLAVVTLAAPARRAALSGRRSSG